MAELEFSAADSAQQLRPQASIKRAATAVTAFVGRALKGPVNQPIAISSFDDYQRIFGGLWQPSTLSYALEQYFQNGGRDAIVVRVCNGGYAPTLRLPAGAAALTLIGLWPGTREFLRASVDYDGIDDRRERSLQSGDPAHSRAGIRIHRGPGNIPPRVDLSAAERGVAGVLTGSRLVRARGVLPRQRPDLTGGAPPGAAVGYVMSNNDGDDGDTLTNYDIIGDAKSGSGLFALQGAEAFNFLCVPPLAHDVDIGLPALLVALRVCRQRQAMLLVDPPAAWSDAVAAIDGLRNWPLYSEDALMFYPRVLAFDRLRGRHEVFGSAAAAAGLLARLDRSGPVWADAETAEEALLRPALRSATSTNDLDHVRLSHAGVNLLQSTRVAARALPPPRISLRTLVAEAAARSDWRELALRRLALFVINSVERGTRWVAYEKSGPALWARVSSQVTQFFQALDQEGAFVGRGSAARNYFVICDERLNDAGHVAAGNCSCCSALPPHVRATSRPAWSLTSRAAAACAPSASIATHCHREADHRTRDLGSRGIADRHRHADQPGLGPVSLVQARHRDHRGFDPAQMLDRQAAHRPRQALRYADLDQHDGRQLRQRTDGHGVDGAIGRTDAPMRVHLGPAQADAQLAELCLQRGQQRCAHASGAREAPPAEERALRTLIATQGLARWRTGRQGQPVKLRACSTRFDADNVASEWRVAPATVVGARATLFEL